VSRRCRRVTGDANANYSPLVRWSAPPERPSAILWLVRNHPELKDAQIMRLVGTTKTTIASRNSSRAKRRKTTSTSTPCSPR
jgi:hypothetical protein